MKLSAHVTAVLQALWVTFLWSTSWVLIKIGLADIPPLTFAGLRYTLAFLCLLPFVINRHHLAALAALPRRQWRLLAVLGLLFYTVTQGAQFAGLAYLSSATASLLFNFTSVFVALFGVALLAERPSPLQWLGVALSTSGAGIYFYPVSLPREQWIGAGIIGVGVLAGALSSILGRTINKSKVLSPISVTAVSMGIGAVALLGSGVAAQGLPRLTLTHWLIILWLAVANTAFAFTLWNNTLRTLSATESSIINSTMLIQIAILAWVFLGEPLNAKQVAGLGVATLGVVLVQLRRAPQTAAPEYEPRAPIR